MSHLASPPFLPRLFLRVDLSLSPRCFLLMGPCASSVHT